MKAEEIAEKEFLINYDYHSFKDSYIDGFIKGYNYDKWIKCSERLPIDRSSIMLFHTKYKQIQGYFETKDGVFWDNSSSLAFETNTITHWQPLPSNPKEL